MRSPTDFRGGTTVGYITLAVLLVRISYVYAAPLRNPNDPAAVTQYAAPWVNEPDGRGTWTILYSCMFTIGLCVWSAIHLNIPGPGEHSSAQFWRKIKWVFIAILAPEIVLYSAWQQFYQARKLCEALNTMADQDERKVNDGDTGIAKEKRLQVALERARSFPACMWNALRACFSCSSQIDEGRASNTTPKPRFSLRFGYFAIMGGLAVDAHALYDNINVLTLGPSGIFFLAKSSSWKHFVVSDEYIKDKSKADNVVKALVLVQVLWTILQCIARAVLQYPLTILEVHTLIHAVCALTMYGIWFRKPFDIRAPLLLEPDLFMEEFALMLLNSRWLKDPKPSNHRQAEPSAWLGRAKAIGFELNSTTASAVPRPTWSSEADYILCNLEMLRASYAPSDSTSREPQCNQSKPNHMLPPYVIQAPGQPSNPTTKNPDRVPSQCPQEAITATPAEVTVVATAKRNLKGPVTNDSNAADLITFTICPSEDVESVVTLVTGDIFPFGFGPKYITISDSGEGAVRDFSSEYQIISDEVREWLKDMRAFGVWRMALRISLSTKDFQRWRLASRALAKRAEEWSLERSGTRPLIVITSDLKFWQLDGLGTGYYSPHATYRSRNLDSDLFGHLFETSPGPIRWYLASSFVFISAAYAVVHLALWNFDFPSFAESLLWKLSASFMLMPLVMLISFSIWHLVVTFMPRFQHWSRRHRTVEKYVDVLTFIAIGFGGFIYCLSRVYIVVESFISLRRVPIGVYNDIAWSQYIPHF